jgi:hypothetical protein
MKAIHLLVGFALIILSGCCKKHPENKEAVRFQLFYAPFPKDFDGDVSLGSQVSVGQWYSRLFYIDTQTGKIWAYSPEQHDRSADGATTTHEEGFVAVTVVNDIADLASSTNPPSPKLRLIPKRLTPP